VLRGFEETARQLAEFSAEANQPVRIVVIGHADSSGPEGTNLEIFRTRAQTLMGRLAAAGFPEGRLAVRAAGSRQPLNPADPEHERALNRRVTFEVILPES
jgi:outer membrane protein OmpA-like peptidoglycan-associated protein